VGGAVVRRAVGVAGAVVAVDSRDVLAVADGVGVGLAADLPVLSSSVWFRHKYSRIVRPERCTSAATARPR
jgi:hypothetical protein